MIHFLLDPPEVCSSVLSKFIEEYDGKNFIATHYYIDRLECEIADRIELIHYFCKNQRLRWTAKKFIYRFMERRKASPANSRNNTRIDLEEFGPGDRTIRLFSPDSKLKYYTFLFSDIQRIVRTAITFSYEYVPAPNTPKNPYTGKEFTVQELSEIFRHYNLNDYDEYSYAFKKAGFNLFIYQRMNNNMLVKAAINNTIRELSAIQLYHEVLEVFDNINHNSFNRPAFRNVMTGALDPDIIEGMRRFVIDYTMSTQLGFSIARPITMSWSAWAMYIIGFSTMYNKEVLRLESEGRKRYRDIQQDITRRTRLRTTGTAIEHERDDASEDADDEDSDDYGWSDPSHDLTYEDIDQQDQEDEQDQEDVTVQPRIRFVVGAPSSLTTMSEDEEFRDLLRRIFGEVEPGIPRHADLSGNRTETFWGGEAVTFSITQNPADQQQTTADQQQNPADQQQDTAERSPGEL
jgi:hypothetical protein